MTDDPANSNVPYDWELNGHPAKLIRDWHPLPILDPDIRTQLRRTLLEALREAAPRLATMGLDAISECHALGHPAWVEDPETGRIVRLDPDGSRHVEEPRPYSTDGLDVLRTIRPTRRPDGHIVDD